MRSWIPSRSTLTTIGFFGFNSGVGVGLDFCAGEGDFFSSAFFSSPSFSFCLARFCSALPTSSLRGPSGGSVSLAKVTRSEEHTSELQSRFDLVCRLLLEKKKQNC